MLVKAERATVIVAVEFAKKLFPPPTAVQLIKSADTKFGKPSNVKSGNTVSDGKFK